MTRQCLQDRRFATLVELRRETKAWHCTVNQRQRGVDWQFRIDDARVKLRSVYPKSWCDKALVALGMAEYRGGNDAAAVEALLASAKAGPDNQVLMGIAAYYRAMSLFRQGKKDDARKLAIDTAARMKPLPKDEENPLTDGAYWDHLILWLAYKEAKAMIQFDAAPPAKTEKNEK
jgi:hypothetical protein